MIKRMKGMDHRSYTNTEGHNNPIRTTDPRSGKEDEIAICRAIAIEAPEPLKVRNKPLTATSNMVVVVEAEKVVGSEMVEVGS